MTGSIGKPDIVEMPLSSSYFRAKVERFLSANGIRLEDVNLFFAIQDSEENIIAGGGLKDDVIKCVAVSSEARSEGLSMPLVSHLVSVASTEGHTNLKVFTKPENENIFTGLGFHLIARAPKAILMENGRGLEDYLASLPRTAFCHPEHPTVPERCPELAEGPVEGSSGVIVMNANPFTLGHQYLVRKASEAVGQLFIIPVRDDIAGGFPYEERLAMIKAGTEGLATVVGGSGYQISETTFPTYFLKDLSDVSETQIRLDLDLFGRHIAPVLGATVRFVGSEPADPLTARYNALMKEILPGCGISVVEIPRLVFPSDSPCHPEHPSVPERCPEIVEGSVPAGWLEGHSEGSVTVSASAVRQYLTEGHFREAAALTPKTTWPYLVAGLMSRAMRIELDAPCKPGLVDPSGNGAHTDMDYRLMKGSIDVIRRSFIRHIPMILPSLTPGLTAFGKTIEKDVLEYTGGVNTYRGAIFSLGLTAVAALKLCGAQMAAFTSQK
ncbi:MAG: triphosphoribosyl-dephospho-CoA synthase, partial [Bacteroidales bacterium]|nr:triphosphoribosyl-dephospho-CoA synthase [Bacteroidales bacterium]